MATYLLLRDNRQSGPYTFDELKGKGLKAYDLVWIEGKSAAWRYPCEIDEFSAFAPKVEEQPFDRFYKKPSQNNTNNTPVTPIPDRSTADTVVAASVISGDTSSIPGKRIIYVTLPAGKKAAEQPSPPREPLPNTHEKYLPDYVPPAIPASPVGMTEDNTSHYNEDWKSAVEISPRIRRKNPRIGQSIVVGLTVVALLAAGIFIGLSINKDSAGIAKKLSLNNSKDKEEPLKTPPAVQPLAVTSLPQPTPAEHTASVKDSLSSVSPATPVTANVPPPRTTVPAKGKTVPATQKSAVSVIPSKDSTLAAAPSIRREAGHRADMSVEKVDKDVIKNNLSNLVSLGASGYTVGTFGGISDLQLTVSNHSVYSLDLVVVEVQYIQSNKKVFKTENLYFRSIAPGSALMQEAPKSTRGIKVQYKITLVNSKELNLSYSAL